MRKVLLTIAILSTIAIASTASAQSTPYFQVYFDEYFTQTAADCPPGPIGSVLDTLYVVAHNFNAWVLSTDFRLQWSPYLTNLGETAIGTPLSIGNTTDGIAVTWTSRKSGWQPVPILQITVAWMCNNCDGIGGTPESEIIVLPYPGQPDPRFKEYGTGIDIYGVGMTSLICAQVPVEETTWGQIKSLYN
ncbi:MAG: hypothetical protein PVF33_07965 [Candidatus Latescibacterota bacterium]